MGGILVPARGSTPHRKEEKNLPGTAVNNADRPDRPHWKVEELLAGSWRGATSVLISNGRCHIVVDTGMPHEAHLLVKALEKNAGL